MGVPPDLPSMRQLRYFVTLADNGQYRRAAERLGISQPSLSLQIAALENRVGQRLVERRRGGLVLTPAGREILPRARDILAQAEDLAALARSLDAGVTGTLRLGATPTIGPYMLPGILRHLHETHPELKLLARDGPPRDMIEDLLAGAHDLVVTQLPLAAADLSLRPLYREPLFLAVARDHALAARARVGTADLAGLDMLSLGPAHALHGQITRLCRDTGARLRSEYEGTSLDALRQMVAMNMGATLLPALYLRSEMPAHDTDVVAVPFHPVMTRTVGVAWRRSLGHPRLIARFLEAADAVVADAYKGLVVQMRGA
ncbi:hydrogen peroxide-inducible genes activator [Lutimaribacter sp. EGI FJ00015]|uniref:Hydrogen peroxide-inducible genes activator n=1 Tax=Lutimaribacter degradans TaxID=2945989 RepID=A0ACC5ZRU7_9RHOB|nr:hydrogen peroxide-inducible genes activator [Lutimaribacter sp. EGI FJ00013]MCM2561053.1 hydrogen peroxide-inducible genes activator [Lutimaribacter sp. EGI FJ00013]MCO0611999.1 hydrogen peroxide-inducible genes activator [Lutimaribacter sp. EGI FJ00015]MCO0634881.1 hydrogen peroxide-inducible genes activator [Lutimaribacter sp. EGI FJ00014]